MRHPDCPNRLMSSTGIGICISPGHLEYKKRVKPLTCLRCGEGTPRQGDNSETPSRTPQEPCERHLEITPLWTLKYAQSGWEPPPCPRGYRPRSDNPDSEGAWTFELIRMPCRHLEVLPAEKGPCGYQRIKRRCRIIESFIGDKICEICRSRVDV